MTQGKRITKAILRTIARGENRSSLFWWMVENHDRIASAAGKRIYWKGFCEEAAARGLSDANGNAPSIETARTTWRRARDEVAAARERDAAANATRRVGSKPPSRLPATWRPAAFATPDAAARQGPAKPPSSGNTTPPVISAPRQGTNAAVAATAVEGTFVDPDDPPEVQQMFLNIEAQLRRADRYLGPPMKKRTD